MFASLPGVSAPPPFGGSARTVVVRVDPDRLRSYNMSPDEVVDALTTGQHDQPVGARPDRRRDADRAGQLDGRQAAGAGEHPDPARAQRVYLRDVATVEDATDIPTGYALVNGRRAVYILVTKRADASTLAVVNAREGEPADRCRRSCRRRHRGQLRVRPVADVTRADRRAWRPRGCSGPS